MFSLAEKKNEKNLKLKLQIEFGINIKMGNHFTKFFIRNEPISVFICLNYAPINQLLKLK